MAMTKTLESLMQRAASKGEAVRRVRECNIMGGNPYSRDFVEQWKVVFERKLNQDASVFQGWKVYHYGTLIFYCNNACGGAGWVLQDYYGEGASDRDALNGLCEHFGISTRFSYGSKKGFVCV